MFNINGGGILCLHSFGRLTMHETKKDMNLAHPGKAFNDMCGLSGDGGSAFINQH